MLSEVTIYNLSEFDKWFLNQEVIEVLKEIDKEVKKKLPNFEITNIKFVLGFFYFYFFDWCVADYCCFPFTTLE